MAAYNPRSSRGKFASETMGSASPDCVQGFVRFIGTLKNAVDEYNATFKEDSLTFLAPVLTDDYKVDKLEIVRDESHPKESGDIRTKEHSPSSSGTLMDNTNTAHPVKLSPKAQTSSEHGYACSFPEHSGLDQSITVSTEIDSSSNLESVIMAPSSDAISTRNRLSSDLMPPKMCPPTEISSPCSPPKTQGQATPEDDQFEPRRRDSMDGLGGSLPFATNRIKTSCVDASRSRDVSLCRSSTPPPGDRSQTARLSSDTTVDHTQNLQITHAFGPVPRDDATFAHRKSSQATGPNVHVANDTPASVGTKTHLCTPSPQRQSLHHLNRHRNPHKPGQNLTGGRMFGSRLARPQPSVRWSPILPWSPSRKKAIEASWRQTLDTATRGMDIGNGLFNNIGDDPDD